MTKKNINEDIIDAEIVEEDPEVQNQTLLDGADLKEDTDEYLDGLRKERTVVFVCDSRTSPLLLAETISMLSAEKRIGRCAVDVQSAAGRTIAAQFQREGLPYDVITFGKRLDQPRLGEHPKPELHEVPTEEHIPWLLQQAAGITFAEPHAIANMDANIVLIPAMAGSDQIRIDTISDPANSRDLGLTTVPGVVLAAAQQADRELVFIDTPEYGLVREPNGQYHRRIIHIYPGPAEEDEEGGDSSPAV